MRLPAVALLVVLATNSSQAVAGPPPVRKPARHRPALQATSPSAPPAAVKLVIAAPAAQALWSMHVRNDGDVPVIIAADARLLKLEVLPRGASKARVCELPSDMRPADDLQRPLVLPPGREYTETFDPRLYCLDGADLDALAPTSIVVAHLGWGGGGRSSPFEVAPIEGVEPAIAPRKAIDAEPLLLPDDPTPAQGRGRGADLPGLVLTSARSVDSDSPNRIEVPVTLHNDGARPVVVRFRPDTVAFDVIGPSGAQHCSWPVLPAAPMGELFAPLPPNGSTSLSLELAAYCPLKTFDQAGLLIVKPRFDTRGASGARIGIRAFEGTVVASTPTFIRLRHGRTTPALTRPQLGPASPAPPEATAPPAPPAPPAP